LQDTHVANGANSKTNYGYATTLNVATSPVNQDQSSIAMLKFDLTQARAGSPLLRPKLNKAYTALCCSMRKRPTLERTVRCA